MVQTDPIALPHVMQKRTDYLYQAVQGFNPYLVSFKLGQLGLLNQIINDLDSKPSEFERQNPPYSNLTKKIGF